MARGLAPLEADALDELTPRCRRCVFWELGDRRPHAEDDEALVGDGRAAADRVRKQAWVTTRALETGPPGVVVRRGRRTVGHAVFAPARTFAQRGGTVPPTDPDALLLATAWLAPEARSGGIGMELVRAAVKEALRLDLRAVEAYGDRRAREWDCVLPAAWLVHVGFEVTAEHPRYPLHRLDVRRAARWAESLEHAVEGILGRAPRPAPVRVPTTADRG